MRLCNNCGKPSNGEAEQACGSCGYVPVKLGGHVAFAPELAAGGAGFEAAYFDTLSKLEEGYFWFVSRNSLLAWALDKYFPRVSSFLEIGCGTGIVLSGMRSPFPDLALTGSEVFTAGLAIAARRLPDTDLFQMDARHIPFARHFDVIGAFDVLEHIEEDEQVLAQMHQAVRQKGGIMLTVPQHPCLWSKTDDYARHVRRYRAGELRNKVERAGFKVLRMTSFVSLLLPLMLASRLKQRSSRQFNPTAEFEIGVQANKLLGSVMNFERALIQAGLSFPAGGSLLLIGKRL